MTGERDFFSEELERERQTRNNLEGKIVMLQRDNDNFLIQLKEENIKRTTFFNEYFEKEEQLMKEKEEVKKERVYLNERLKIVRGYLRKMADGSLGQYDRAHRLGRART